MDVKCQCGAISFKTSTTKPLALYHCHCLECRKQSASAFGTSAIFPSEGIFPLSESLSKNLGHWSRPGEESGGTQNCYFCKTCGVRVFHRNQRKDGIFGPNVSIKGGLVEGLEWSGGKHIYCRTALFPIPEGAEKWEGPPDKR